MLKEMFDCVTKLLVNSNHELLPEKLAINFTGIGMGG